MPPSPPDEADAGALVEGQQRSDDDVSLCGCYGHQQESSSFTSHPIIGPFLQNQLEPGDDFPTRPSNLLYVEEMVTGT